MFLSIIWANYWVNRQIIIPGITSWGMKEASLLIMYALLDKIHIFNGMVTFPLS